MIRIRNRPGSTVGIVIAIALGVVVGAGAASLERQAQVGAGYAAKSLCSGVFVSGRPPVIATADLPENPMVSMLRFSVDRVQRSAEASIGGIGRRRALFLGDLGCVLLPPGVDRLAFSTPSPASRQERMWPGGQPVAAEDVVDVDAAALRSAVDGAFEEPDPEHPLRTRAVVVVRGGRVIAERYASGFDRETPLIGWSMAKSVTGTLVGILVRDGILTTDQDHLLPAWSEEGDPRGAITLDDMLRMKSGLAFLEDYGDLTSGVVQMLYLREDAGAFAAEQPTVVDPGTRWSYSSGTTNVLTTVLAAAFADPAEYLSFPRRALFDPIGMTTAVLEPDPSGSFIGSSFMYASARDWARLGQLYLDDGVWEGVRILPEGWVEYSTRPTAGSPRGSYGAHWWTNRGDGTDAASREFPELPADMFWASGHEGQRVAVFPSHDLVVVRMGMSQAGNWDDAGFFREILGAFETVDEGATESGSD